MDEKSVLKLKALRVEYGFSQEDVAKALGITIATYSRKENKINNFTAEEVKKLLALFKDSKGEVLRIFFNSEVAEIVTKQKGE